MIGLDRYRRMPMIRFSTLRAHLALLLLITLIPVIGIFGYAAIEDSREDTREIQSDALRLARFVALDQRQLIASVQQLLSSLANLPSVRAPARQGQCDPLFAELLTLQPHYANLGIIRPDGSVRCSGLPMNGPVQLADRTYFREAMASRDFAVGRYQVGRITGKSSINFGYPVTDPDGDLTGVVYAALDLSWLSQIMNEVPHPEGTRLMVFDREGTILAHQPDAGRWVGRSVTEVNQASTLVDRGGEQVVESIDSAGMRRLYAFAPLHDSAEGAIFVAAGIPTRVAYAQHVALIKRTMSLIALVAVLVFVIAVFGYHRFIQKPLRLLTRASERIGQGDLSARTGLAHGPLELRSLARTFDHMGDTLAKRETELEHSQRALRHSNRALRALSHGNRALLHAEDEQYLLRKMCEVVVHEAGYRLARVIYAGGDEPYTMQPVAHIEAQDMGGGDPGRAWSDDDAACKGCRTAMRTGAPYIQAHAQTHGGHYEMALHLPLRLNGDVTGCLCIYADERDAFDDAEVRLLSEMADDLSFGLEAIQTRKSKEIAEQTIKDMAYHDAQTGLPNHLLLDESLRKAVEQAHHTGGSVALLLLDLKNLHDINDTLGFDEGNKVIDRAADRLRKAVGDAEMVARMRGDEFAVLLPEAGEARAVQMAGHIQQALATPVAVDKLALDIRSCIGIALFPAHAEEAQQLVQRADTAMQHAKETSEDYEIYQPEYDQHKTRHLQIATELRRALEAGGLHLHFQPKIDMRMGQVCGAEALLRWHHPELGTVRPDEFVSVAEHTGLIRELSEWVLENALRQSHEWRQSGMELPIAVNLSAKNLQDPSIPDKIERLRSKWGIQTGMLEIEITESALMADPESALNMLNCISTLGIPIYVDDFGTGYSSLSYLKRFPVNSIKIDQSFVFDMLTNNESGIIVKATIMLAHDLGLGVVAEGVEDQQAWDRLEALACDTAQGYFMARPLPADEFVEWLGQSRWRSPGGRRADGTA